MDLYHFCAIWKLLDIKDFVVPGEPPFIGGDSNLPTPPTLPDLLAAGGHAGWAWTPPKRGTRLLFVPSEQQPAPNGLTVPKHAPRRPQTSHTHGEARKNPPEQRTGEKYSDGDSPELGTTQAFNSPRYGDRFQLLPSYSKFFVCFFSFASFCHSL